MTPEHAATPIPAEWRDPKHVMPHLAAEVGDWVTQLRQLDQDLAVVQGALEQAEEIVVATPVGQATGPAPDTTDVLAEWVTSIRAQLAEVTHQLAGRAQTFRLIAEDLKRG
jgi:hypothetical protein